MEGATRSYYYIADVDAMIGRESIEREFATGFYIRSSEYWCRIERAWTSTSAYRQEDLFRLLSFGHRVHVYVDSERRTQNPRYTGQFPCSRVDSDGYEEAKPPQTSGSAPEARGDKIR